MKYWIFFSRNPYPLVPILNVNLDLRTYPLSFIILDVVMLDGSLCPKIC